jgi:NAD(P)-dependent dehydrogenase (short-subunit alcohol dehydrogenase family)
MSGEFSGRCVLITGAASGIGRETAFAFAEAGAILVLVDVDPEGLERTALLCEKLDATVHARVVDVAVAREMAALAEFVHARFSAVDVLVNNAGVAVAGSFVGTELTLWDWALSINVMGVIHGCHHFVPRMVERGRGGHVVNVASAAGLVATRQLSVYSTTKFAVVGFSESLRAELAPHGISVSTICPGVIDTPITRSVRLSGDLAKRKGFHERVSALYHRRNYGPERVAHAIMAAVRGRRGLVPVTPEAWALYLGKRIAPRLLGRLMERAPSI